jgi:peroxisomal membrane protein 4
MIFLFRSGSVQEKLKLIFKATKTHAANLARFATVYKLSMIALKHMGSTPGKEGPYDTFFAGLLGGYVVFGRKSRNGKISSINNQIVIYVFARVVLAIAKLAVQPNMGLVTRKDTSSKITEQAWPVFAAMTWGTVMFMFRWYPDNIQSSLKNSMQYIYADSDHWDSVRTWIWHNK